MTTRPHLKDLDDGTVVAECRFVKTGEDQVTMHFSTEAWETEAREWELTEREAATVVGAILIAIDTVHAQRAVNDFLNQFMSQPTQENTES